VREGTKEGKRTFPSSFYDGERKRRNRNLTSNLPGREGGKHTNLREKKGRASRTLICPNKREGKGRKCGLFTGRGISGKGKPFRRTAERKKKEKRKKGLHSSLASN